MGVAGTTDVLVIGSGGREHALAWKLRQSARVGRILIAPGNGGTAGVGQNIAIADTDIPGLLKAVKEHGIGLTVVGPEAPLAAGVVDALQAAGHPVFGPTRAAARLESSKAWAKAFMVRHGIPTAGATAFKSAAEAVAYIDHLGADRKVVVKADGLAAGKGVIVADSRADARAAVRSLYSGAVPASAISQVLIEERLSGPEVSVFAFVDGSHVSAEVAACDYKRVGDGDVGPNTGGMGAYSPPEFWTAELAARIRRKILEPTAAGMASEGNPYLGVIYAGLMLTEDGPKVIEFNCRLGDPEAQVVLPRLKTDLFEVLLASVEGRLASLTVDWSGGSHVAVVMASGGYPGKYTTGKEIRGLEERREALVFQAGTVAAGGGRTITSGGRVLAVVAGGADIESARAAAYEGVGSVEFEGAIFRKDIAARAVRGGGARP